MTVTDEWSTPSYQGPTPSTTRDSPTKRASRHSRISNEIEHFSFKRTSSTPSRDEETTEYRIGDAVLVDDSVKLKQKFLHPPLYQLSSTSSSSTNSKLKGNKKNKAVRDKVEEYTGWKHQDGLKSGDKVAVITRLYQDVRGTKMALVRWFARPGAVWGESGPQDDEVGNKTLPVRFLFSPAFLSLLLMEWGFLAVRVVLHSRFFSPNRTARNRTTTTRETFPFEIPLQAHFVLLIHLFRRFPQNSSPQ